MAERRGLPAGVRFRNPYRDPASTGPKCPSDLHPLEPVEHESKQGFLACPACYGAWLDFDVFTAILDWGARQGAAAPADDDSHLAKVYEMGRQKSRAPLSCPVCGEEMIAEEHKRDSYILVDICPSGCGKWLDDGELRKLIAYAKARHG